MTTKKAPIRKLTEECSPDEGIVPDEIGPFLPVTHADVGWFNDFISDEVDSAYSSSICCCDSCYDSFVAHWPDVYFREEEFQTQSMGFDVFIEGSRLVDIYSPAELSSLTRFAECPNCLAQNPPNVWIYEHRFSGAKEIENSIDELLTLGSVTPFLLLQHHFAQRVLAEIRKQIQKTKRRQLDKPLYRARRAEDVDDRCQMPDDLQTYLAPPAAYVGEGRYNHAGAPMVYLASSANTAAAELAVPGKDCYVGELVVAGEFLVLDLVEIDEDDESYDILKALATSALLAAPRTGDGWVKRQYVFSRFVADCSRSAGFDAIRYGSTKHSDQSNWVLLNAADDFVSMASLVRYTTVRSGAREGR